MPYLTNYSFRQLTNKIELKDFGKIDLDTFKEHIYNNDYLFYFFNQLDLKNLIKQKFLLDSNDYEMFVYREVPERKDNLTYVLELKGKVKYHLDPNCKNLNKGFKNFFIPEPIVRLQSEDPNKHIELVKAIREWFTINDYTVEKYEQGILTNEILTKAFNNYFPAKFGIEKIFISSGGEANQFQWYHSLSTSSVQVEYQFDHDNFLDKVIDLIKRREYLTSSKTMQNLSKYDYLVQKEDYEIIDLITSNINKGYLKDVSINFIDNYGLENLRNFWTNHHKLKMEAFYLLSDYIKWNYNLKEKDFDQLFLERFNLECCQTCKIGIGSNRVTLRPIL
ncbi:hypothetical protein IF128_07635 [Empedobacter stercoris]|uniref:hypothetical protein n=1 Tax=Empedobacter stercoris TaxID=1628248 RepID=UPI001662420C|nr:hypothetical protein [Empedobacter stercoris]MCA4809611.1 hypothetical protein [Empedobacter stercoris]QNT13534.1 hypothetical protein HNV03_01935 [Empedobacter stercoris]